MSWRKHLKDLLPRQQAPAAPPLPPPKPPAAPRKRAPRHVAVTVLGMEGAALEQVITTAQTQCAARGARPIFVTDGHDFTPFRQRKLTVEQVVDAEARLLTAPDLAWRSYRRRQYTLIAARWRPIAVVSFGRSPDEDCLEALQKEP
jgi:hypothetical protein